MGSKQGKFGYLGGKLEIKWIIGGKSYNWGVKSLKIDQNSGVSLEGGGGYAARIYTIA